MNTLTFDPDIHIREIVLVGLGGTGSQLARSVCRILFDMRTRNQSVPALRFIDPDIIETKNVGRQMFTPADVGAYKAETLARRFSLALGLPIVWHNQPFEPDKYLGSSLNSTLLLGAVDNHLARQTLHKVNGLWIDCGNSFDNGSVIIGNTSSRDTLRRGLSRAEQHEVDLRYLPSAGLLFPALLEPDPEPVPQVSCADLVQMGDQQLLINDWVALVAAQYVYKLLHRKPIASFMTFVEADTMGVRSIPICRENLEGYMAGDLSPIAVEPPVTFYDANEEDEDEYEEAGEFDYE